MNKMKIIPKNELIENRKYCGYCHNSNIALWKDGVFHIIRNKFGFTFEETLPAYEDRVGNYDYFEAKKLLEDF